MILSRIGSELAVMAVVAVLAVLCVAAIFFFPAIQGPYSAVNGPVTALQSAQGAARLRVAIIQAAFSLISNFQVPLLVWVWSAIVLSIEPEAPSCVECITTLRC
jgi:hypothetical protein